MRYKITVYNNKNERISRGNHSYKSQRESTFIVGEDELALVKHCRFLTIRSLEYACLICGKTFDTIKGLKMHENMTHGG